MGKLPIESNFYVSVSDKEVEVQFAPTKSIYAISTATSAVAIGGTNTGTAMPTRATG
jgi:hypothetical protein